MENKGKIIQTSLDGVLHSSMMPYAEHVILDRALPRVEDGLKPVQRRILYTMYEMGLTPDKPHKKCARIVGDCLGKYHPHGDSSVYDALVRMAQDFNMRMTLINGHGNFGSVDGDSAAAYRYTEAKLEPLSLELLRDLDKDTVNFSLNFDDSLLEPDTIPGRYPNLLVNGASGIAVGLATNIPPHNLGEVIDGTIALIDNPKISLKDMMKYIKGPDFPTGGYIIAGEELTNAYQTGRGKIKMRAKVSVETEHGGKESLVITELPYQVNKANLLKKIVDLKEEKKELFADVHDVVDESDRNGMRAVIKLKKDAKSKKILEALYKYSDLECTFGINMVAIADGKPRQLGLIEILTYYVNYQREVILRRSKYDLDRAKERAHILEGLIIAVKNIDAVIKIIKNSANTTEAKANLRAKFSLSDAQATAILDLRLARLTKLEIYKLEEELKQLKELIKQLTAIIGSKKLQMEVVKTELLQIKKKYKDDRRSKIVGDVKNVKVEEAEEEKVVAKNFVVTVTTGGMFKKVSDKNFNMSEKTPSTEKDALIFTLPVQSTDTVIAFTNKGNAFKLDMEIVPECKLREKGSKFTDIHKEATVGEYPVSAFVLKENAQGYLLLFTKDGLIKKTEWAEYNLQKSMYQAIKLKEGDMLLTVEEDKPETTIAYITENGLCLNALKDDIPVQGRVAGGVKGINLNDGDSIIFVSQVEDSGEFITITSSGMFKRVLVFDIEPMARYRKGVKICTLAEGDKLVYGGFVQEPFDIAVFDEEVSFTVNTESISIEGRTTKGKTLKNEYKKCKPTKCFQIKK